MRKTADFKRFFPRNPAPARSILAKRPTMRILAGENGILTDTATTDKPPTC